MFRKWTSKCKSFVKIGKNTLYILFESPIRKAKELKSGPELPGGDRVYTRKAAYQYGWDFGPRFVTSGIWKQVYIEESNNLHIFNLNYNVKLINNNLAKVNFSIEFINDSLNGTYVYEITDTLKKVVVFCDSIDPHGTNHIWDGLVFDPKMNLSLVSITKEFEIKDPILWWCNGLGKPYLYHYKIKLFKNNTIVDEKCINIGVRKIELINKIDSIGTSFYFQLNGVPIFIKGANYIPQDIFLTRYTDDRYQRLLNNVVKSNINMLRVWGGGIYENDKFYDMCDENGILIWQDFMCANSMFNIDTIFFNNIGSEFLDIFDHLICHPSLAIICGNNEIEEGWYNWGWQNEFNYSIADSEKIWNDYTKFFNNIIKKEVQKYSPYISTTPKIGWGHPEAMKEGDSHYWGVWWGMEPFEMYEKKIPRFMSEYGFQGFPDMKTIEQFTKPEDRYLNSPVMRAHQKHPTGYETIQTYMEREYKQPKDFESYVYVSQLLQAYGIKRAIEAERRAKLYCMGTMYWQLNDCWPGVTWSGIDYYGRWKAMQYFVKEAYKDILVSVKEENDSIKVYIINDRMESVKGNLLLGLFDIEGTNELDIIHSKDINLRGKHIPFLVFDNTVISPNSSEVIYTCSKKDLFSNYSPNKIVFTLNFSDENDNTYKNLYYFVSPKDLALFNPEMSYYLDSTTDELVLTTKNLAKNVHITIDDESAPLNLENNYFDMLPGETVRVNLGMKNPDINKIKVNTLFDSYEK